VSQRAAWFGEARHPAEGIDCPTCGARVGKPCVVTTSMPGTCVGAQMPIRGMHAARLQAQIAEAS